MKFKKFTCMFFVVALITSATGAIVQAQDKQKDSSNDLIIGTVKECNDDSSFAIISTDFSIFGIKALNFKEIAISNQGLSAGDEIEFEISQSSPVKSMGLVVKAVMCRLTGKIFSPPVEIRRIIKDKEVVNPTDEDPTDEDQVEKPSNEKKLIQGYVFETDGITPISGALIEVSPSNMLPYIGYETLTKKADDIGYFAVDDISVPDDKYIDVLISKFGYKTESRKLYLGGVDSAIRLDVMLGKDVEEGEEEEAAPDLDLEICDIEKVFDEENIELEEVNVEVSITNKGQALADVSLDFEITGSDNEVIEYVVLFDERPILRVDSSDEETVVVDILSSLKGPDGSLKPDDYEVRAICSCMGVEEVSSPYALEIDEPFDPHAFLANVNNKIALEMLKKLSFNSDGNLDAWGLNDGVVVPGGVPYLYITAAMYEAGANDNDIVDEIANDVLEIGEENINKFLYAMDAQSGYLNSYDQDGVYKNSMYIRFDQSLEKYLSTNFLNNLGNINSNPGFLDYSTSAAKQDSISTIKQSIKDDTNGVIDLDNIALPEGYETELGVSDIRSGDNFDLLTDFPHINANSYCEFEFVPDFEDIGTRKFYPDNGYQRTASAIRYSGNAEGFAFTEESNCKVLSIPCEDGCSIIYLDPKDGYTVSEVLSSIDGTKISDIMESLSEFKQNDHIELILFKPFIGAGNNGWNGRHDTLSMFSLQDLGMIDAGSPDADFSNMLSIIEPLSDQEDLSLEASRFLQYVHASCNEDRFKLASCIETASYCASSGGSSGGKSGGNSGGLIPGEKKRIEGSFDDGDGTPETDSSHSYEFNDPHTILFVKDGFIEFAVNVLGIVTSPLVLDLDGDGISTSGLSDGVLFDLDADGRMDLTGWTAGLDDAFLCLDLDCDGVIDDGGELFGDNTVLPDGSKASNGFEALAQYDINEDGKIDGMDSVWSDLLLWVDIDHDGVSEEDELKPVIASRVEEIFLDYSYLNKVDNGNLLRECSSFTTKDGSVHDVIDVWFQMVT